MREAISLSVALNVIEQSGKDPALSSSVHCLGPGQRSSSGAATDVLQDAFECMAAS